MNTARLMSALSMSTVALGCFSGFLFKNKKDIKLEARSSSSSANKENLWNFDWDRRDNETKPNSTEMKSYNSIRHLILIRHGQYDGRGRRKEDHILTKLGREQADYAGKRIKELNIPISKIVMSTMPRAIETGIIISESLPGVPLQYCDLIREGSPILADGGDDDFVPVHHKFFQEGARIEAGFRKYFHRAPPDQKEDTYELLVCHANVISYFVCRALQLAPEFWLRMTLYNCSLTWLSILPNGRVILQSFSETGFIPPDKLSLNTVGVPLQSWMISPSDSSHDGDNQKE